MKISFDLKLRKYVSRCISVGFFVPILVYKYLRVSLILKFHFLDEATTSLLL